MLKHHTAKTHEGVKVYHHPFLTLVLHGGGCSASRPGLLTPGERALDTH